MSIKTHYLGEKIQGDFLVICGVLVVNIKEIIILKAWKNDFEWQQNRMYNYMKKKRQSTIDSGNGSNLECELREPVDNTGNIKLSKIKYDFYKASNYIENGKLVWNIACNDIHTEIESKILEPD